jgi:hypothetical protein
MESLHVPKTHTGTMNLLPLQKSVECSPSPWVEHWGEGDSDHRQSRPQPRRNTRLHQHAVHGELQTENPKGIPSQSPGLPSLRGYPGFKVAKSNNPERVAPGMSLSTVGTEAYWSLAIGVFWDLGFGIWSFPRPVHGRRRSPRRER